MASIPISLTVLLFLLSTAAAISPISDLHRSAAVDLFAHADGSSASLEEAYEAARTFQILGIGSESDAVKSTCSTVEKTIGSDSAELRELLYALRVGSVLGCVVDEEKLQVVGSRFLAVTESSKSLLDLYYAIGGLVLAKERGLKVELLNADGVFYSVKSLCQSDGRWRYSPNDVESSAYASGIALETVAGVISLAGEVDQSMVGIVKNDIAKLFDSIKSYNDGSLYFDDELVDDSKYRGPLSTTSSVVRGLAKFASVASGKINISGDKVLGLANFFLNIGVPGSKADFFNQIESLSFLENNRVYIPLILSLPSTVLSLTSKDKLKVKVTTVFGSSAPPLTVNLEHVSASGSRGKSSLEDLELEYDKESSMHVLDIISKDLDIGKYSLSFKVLLHDPEHMDIYATGRQIQSALFVTGLVKIDNAEISVLDSDAGNADSKKGLDLLEGKSLSLAANHLQKLHISFELSTPLDSPFNPHQVFIKLIHETKVEHIFVLENSGKEHKIVINFLRLVEKLYYLSGRYELSLAVGDALMENSFSRVLAHLELDLPDAPEKAPQPPPQAVDPYSKFQPKTEISHIFRAPEKRPPKELSLTFLAITIVPLLGFVFGLTQLGVNVKNFPSPTMPATFSLLFHAGIAAVLSLYTLFWLKLDLFTTLKFLGVLGAFLIFVGHGALSHIAAASTKLKSS